MGKGLFEKLFMRHDENVSPDNILVNSRFNSEPDKPKFDRGEMEHRILYNIDYKSKNFLPKKYRNPKYYSDFDGYIITVPDTWYEGKPVDNLIIKNLSDSDIKELYNNRVKYILNEADLINKINELEKVQNGVTPEGGIYLLKNKYNVNYRDSILNHLRSNSEAFLADSWYEGPKMDGNDLSAIFDRMLPFMGTISGGTIIVKFYENDIFLDGDLVKYNKKCTTSYGDDDESFYGFYNNRTIIFELNTAGMVTNIDISEE